MRIVHEASDSDASGRSERRCFYCHRYLSFPHLGWLGEVDGSLRRIYLHPECAREFMDRLSAELAELGRRSVTPLCITGTPVSQASVCDPTVG
jgi:hypothetical protein